MDADEFLLVEKLNQLGVKVKIDETEVTPTFPDGDQFGIASCTHSLGSFMTAEIYTHKWPDKAEQARD